MILSLKTYLILAAVAACIALGAFGAWRIVKPALDRQKAATATAKVEAKVATDTTRIIEKTFTNERTVFRQAEARADAVQTAPGADQPVPPDVLSAWRAGVDGLRVSSPAAADPDPQ